MNAIYQMTEKEYANKRAQLSALKEEHERSLQDMKAAREDGDLSENSVYDAARDRYRETQTEIVKLSDELANCEIVHDDNSPIIKIGSIVRVTRLDDSGKNATGQPRQFTVASNGDTIIRKCIGIASPLGKAILGKSSGVFSVICNGKKYYKVEKVFDENEEN